MSYCVCVRVDWSTIEPANVLAAKITKWFGDAPIIVPSGSPAEEFAELPATLTLRELRIEQTRPGFRSKTIDVLTSLLDAELYLKSELADLFRQRWHAELDLRSIKIVLQMDVLRCKTPSMVRKEIWAHMLGYNLIRSLMCATALAHGVGVREISFKGIQQLFQAFWLSIVNGSTRSELANCCEAIMQSGVAQSVGHRPDRVEPRKRKRNPSLIQQ